HPPKWTGYQLLALIFGTLLSSQGTDASFVLTRSSNYWGFPPGFRSVVLAFPTLSDSFVSDFPRCFRGCALSRFPFPAIQTLAVNFRLSDHRPFTERARGKYGD
ncbi:hypothetical protein ACFXPI_26605, partial [Streptomyces sp. NPDC059104]|uniref:hypothetical protein n=1 Tax=Streptomyces sp. NPDC059104 TaxID=3346729 RepID=UPI0036A2D3A8